MTFITSRGIINDVGVNLGARFSLATLFAIRIKFIKDILVTIKENAIFSVVLVESEVTGTLHMAG